MMGYIKRRFSSVESQHTSLDDTNTSSELSRQSTAESALRPHTAVSDPSDRSSSSMDQAVHAQMRMELPSEEKSKLLFVIDTEHVDW